MKREKMIEELVKELKENNYVIKKNTERLSHLGILALSLFLAITSKEKWAKLPLLISLLLFIADDLESIAHILRNK